MFLFTILPALLLALVHSAHALPTAHSHVENRALPGVWYQRDDAPAHKLFKRGPPGDEVNYADVGSPAWAADYPHGPPDSTKLPQEWVNALNNAIVAGKIPNIPQTHNVPQTNPVYPDGVNPFDPNICSSTYKCRNPGDYWDAPAGVFGTGFDDGPSFGSDRLNGFLQQNNIIATHFMIGINILNNPNAFSQAVALNQDIAVHTWTHPYMTTLSNLDIVGQLGWTVQIIHDSTGGRLPRFWRPPYGDSDNRVRAIAEEVFGLKAIIWNQDSADWSLSSNGTTLDKIQAQFAGWLSGPKTPGLVVLEHELSDATVQAFISAWPLIQQNGWQAVSVARAVSGGSAYRNSDGPNGAVNPMPVLSGNSTAPAPTSTSSTAQPTPSQSQVTGSNQSQQSSQNNSNNSQKSNAASLLAHGDSRSFFSTLPLAFALSIGASLLI